MKTLYIAYAGDKVIAEHIAKILNVQFGSDTTHFEPTSDSKGSKNSCCIYATVSDTERCQELEKWTWFTVGAREALIFQSTGCISKKPSKDRKCGLQ
jgi:hypothetical protein